MAQIAQQVRQVAQQARRPVVAQGLLALAPVVGVVVAWRV